MIPVPITLIGHPFLAVGRGEHIRAIRRALASIGLSAGVYNVMERPTREEIPSPALAAALVDRVAEGIRIFHCNGNELAWVLKSIDRRQPDFLGRGYNIVFPAWELPLFPREWAEQVDRFDEVWAASGFVDASLRDAVSIPVTHIPNACEPHPSSLLGRGHFDLPADAFVVLFFFDVGSFTSRKNPWAVIETFRKLVAARPSADIHLVIKISRGHLDKAVTTAIRAEVAGFGGQARVVDRTMDDNEIKNLIGCCDCFLSLHRSEGFGRGPAEAMFFGKPAVATGWSGNMEYMDPGVSFPVRFDLVPLKDGDYLHWEDQMWAEADVTDAAAIVTRLVDDRRYARVMGRLGRRHMLRHFSDTVLGRRYERRFLEILDARSPPR